MKMSFSGDFTVNNARQEVYAFLTDPNRFCPILPDFKGMTKDGADHFTVTLSLGISHIRGDAKIKMSLSEAVPPTRAAYSGRGDVIGGTVTLNAAFDLAEMPEGTRVGWRGEAQIVGRLVSLAGGLLEPLAKRNLMKLIDGLQAALSNDQQAVRS
jgi:uncharacterized protein